MLKKLSLLRYLLPVLFAATALAAPVELKKGQRIVLIGNALAERMQHHGWLETYVQAELPEHELRFRNHGFSGDTVTSRPRNKGFIDPHAYLTISKADIIIGFWGYNESFDNNPDQHRDQLVKWVQETQAKQYNGKSAPQVVLCSPIAHEALGDPNLPDGVANNERLLKYTQATEQAAKQAGVPYINLYSATANAYASAEKPLTMNGVHLTSEGNRFVARVLASKLFGLRASSDRDQLEKIRAAVLDKNWHWFNRYRATDGNDVWGGRSNLKFVDNQSNREVLMHELDMIDVMVENRDKAVWAAAQGTSYTVDDSNVPPPVKVVSNVGGKSKSSNAQKEGKLKYSTPEETVAQFKLAKGFKANVFASEEMFPEMVNPVQLGVDTKGRVWAAAWKTYPKWEPLKKMDDRLLILPDEDRDGVADKAITFARIHNPTGFTFWNGGVVVASAPDLVFLKDTDGDDVADVRRRIMHGIDSADTHHAANNLTFGPDGWLYYQRGVFHVSNVETPWSKAQKHGNSAMYRFNPRSFEYSFHANNSPNPHGISFNKWGYHFATDGTGGRAYQVREDGKGGFKMQPLLNKTVRPVASSGILSSSHLPETMQGNFVLCNTIGFLGMKQYSLELKDDGNVWGTEVENLIEATTDRNFRPTDFEIGGDGAVYVSDWQNVIIGHMQHNVRDPNRDHEYGRVYRLTAEGRPLSPKVKVDGEPVKTLLGLLSHPENGVRQRVRIELSERSVDEVIPATQEWATQWDAKNADHALNLLEALWVHQQFHVKNYDLLKQVMESPVVHARNAAKRVDYMWAKDPRVVVAAAAEEKMKALKTSNAELKKRGFSKEDLELYKLGAKVYLREGHCVTCHQPDGKGLPKMYPPLHDSGEWVTGDPERLIKITLKGLWGKLEHKGFVYNGEGNTTPPMTAFRSLLSDKEVAAVLTYVRNTFGNEAPPIRPDLVKKVSKQVEGKTGFYMVDEILKEHPLE